MDVLQFCVVQQHLSPTQEYVGRRYCRGSTAEFTNAIRGFLRCFTKCPESIKISSCICLRKHRVSDLTCECQEEYTSRLCYSHQVWRSCNGKRGAQAFFLRRHSSALQREYPIILFYPKIRHDLLASWHKDEILI